MGIARQATTVLLGRSLSRAFLFIAFVLLARFLTPAEFGWFGVLTTSLSLVAMLGTLGLRQSFAYRIGQGGMSAGAALGTMAISWLPLTLASAVVLYAIYGSALPLIGPVHSALIIGLGVGGVIATTLLQGIYLGEGNIRAFAISESFPRVALTASCAVLAVTASVDLASALWAYVGSIAIAVPFMIHRLLAANPRLKVQLGQLRSMISYGAVFALNLFLITLCARISMFVIQIHLGATAAGLFFAAVRVHEIFLEAASALGMVLFSDAIRQSSGTTVVARNARLACWMFWLFSLGGLAVIAVAPHLVTLVLGSAYAGATPALQILALGLGPAAASKLIYPTLAGHGRALLGTPVVLTSTAITFILALTAVPSLGIVGGAAALVVGQYSLFIGYAIACRRWYGVSLRESFLPRLTDVGILRKRLRSIVAPKRPKRRGA